MILCLSARRGDAVISVSDSSNVDFLIIGQGLAGTALAWALDHYGADYRIVDGDFTPTSSEVAAGLVTPVTGKRFTVAEQYDELAAIAADFYRLVERNTDIDCFSSQPALRLVYEDEERRQFEKRCDGLIQSGHIQLLTDSVAAYRTPSAAFVMPGAARLFTSNYLSASRDYFAQKQRFALATLNPRDIEITEAGVRTPTGLPDARQLIFCGGHEDQFNPRVPTTLFNRAKGEMLRVRINELDEQRTVHALKSWLCPVSQEHEYLFGSTYQHGEFAPGATLEAREDLERRLEQFLPHPYEVVDQTWGVRPIAVQRKAIVGRGPDGLAWLNGLGSKGALLAPYLATELARALVQDAAPKFSLTPVHDIDAH